MATKAITHFFGEYRWLSNFWPAEVTLDGVTYPTIEHAYQASKYPAGSWGRLIILKAKTPHEAKMHGKGADTFLSIKDRASLIPVMKDLVRQKFAHPDLQERLLATGDRHISEGNTWNDTFWGVSRGVGENHLGKILMEVRAEYQNARNKNGY